MKNKYESIKNSSKPTEGGRERERQRDSHQAISDDDNKPINPTPKKESSRTTIVMMMMKKK